MATQVPVAVVRLRRISRVQPGASRLSARNLTAHLYLKRWAQGGTLADRSAAFQRYQEVLTGLKPPQPSRELYEAVVSLMETPEGDWATKPDGERRYSIHATQGGSFVMSAVYPNVLDSPQVRSAEDVARLQSAATRALEFIFNDAAFHAADHAGKFVGAASFRDGNCEYRIALELDEPVSGPMAGGSLLSVHSTITSVAGVYQNLIDSVGKKRARAICRAPGAGAMDVGLYRLNSKREAWLLDLMLEADTKPLVGVSEK